MTNITIVGLGGTGSYLSTPLIRYIRSQKIEVGRILFVDGDKYEEHNADRQEFMTGWAGENKARYAHQKHSQLFPDMRDKFKFIDEYVNEDKIDEIFGENTVLFCCVDNYYFRKIADEHASKLVNCALISGGNDLLDGQVQIVQYTGGVNMTKATLCSRHSEIKNADSGDRSAMTCEELASLPSGGQIVVANMMSATLMIGYFIDYMNNINRKFMETFFNCKDMSFRTVEV